MEAREFDIVGSWLITPQRHSDSRGWFQEWFKKSDINAQCGFEFAPVQANISQSTRGTIRGVHYSIAAAGQAKLVTVLAGEIDDYVVDIRPSSPTYGRWVRQRLSVTSGASILLSPHLGHAFQALTDNAVVAYLTSAEFDPVEELAISPFCPHLAIDWADIGEHVVSPKDAAAPDLKSQHDAGLLPQM